MSNTHIVSAFDRDLEAVQAHVMRMGGLVEQAILDAAEALETLRKAVADLTLDKQVLAEVARGNF